MRVMCDERNIVDKGKALAHTSDWEDEALQPLDVGTARLEPLYPLH